MAFFDQIKLAWKFLISAEKINSNRQILDCQEKLLEMQKIIRQLEEENNSLKIKLESNDYFSRINQFKEIDQNKNSCK